MGKNTILKQLNESSTYDELYPAGAVDYTMLTETTSAAYGVENGSVKDALNGLYQYIHISDVVTIKVVDVSNNPLPNITANGIIGSPQSGTDGVIKGVTDNNSVTLVSPYVDTIKTKTVDVSKYKNTTRTLIVTMDGVADGAIVRYTSSQNVMFSNRVANIDVCCVGGGGAGGRGENASASMGTLGAGGGGGGITNSFSVSVNVGTYYSIIVGSGGAYTGGRNDGSNSSFGGLVTANGGKGVTFNHTTSGLLVSGGAAGSTGAGNGGSGGSAGGANTTLSEFNDGVTFYSGGGGGGVRLYSGDVASTNGGAPNGASGAYVNVTNHIVVKNATIAGIGGGGGAGGDQVTGGVGSAGGPGLVAIKIHLKS